MGMNRAERRRQEREARKFKGPIPVKNEEIVTKKFTRDEFQQFIFDVDYAARVDTINMMMTAFALAEHRVHKHGHIRVRRTLEYVDQLMDDINNKKTTFEQIKQDCLNEVGFNFVNYVEGKAESNE